MTTDLEAPSVTPANDELITAIEELQVTAHENLVVARCGHDREEASRLLYAPSIAHPARLPKSNTENTVKEPIFPAKLTASKSAIRHISHCGNNHLTSQKEADNGTPPIGTVHLCGRSPAAPLALASLPDRGCHRMYSKVKP